METIIQQITIELVEKITKKASGEELGDLDALAAVIFEDCAEAARLILQEVIRLRNLEFRADKAFRKEKGLVLKEKDRPRQILTKLGMIEWERDYYYDKASGQFLYPLDHMLGIRSYERIGDEVTAQLLNRASEVSYARSTDIVTGGQVSRQSVRDHLLKAEIPQVQPAEEGRKVRELHLYADEDHAPLQKPGKKHGKQSQSVPLVTVTEGTRKAGTGRNRTISPMHFADEDLSTKQLWSSVEGYIERAYDIEGIEHIYIHADAGNWIRNGLDGFSQVIHVMDGYHFEKEMKKVAKKYPVRNVRIAIRNALKADDRKSAEEFLLSLPDADEELQRFRTYLFGNWEAIRNRVTLDVPGSCTEGQVSHVLSERLSRNPLGWSRKGLGKMSKLRVYRCNGGKLTGKDMKPGEDQECYREYAERFLKEQLQGALDWSIFEPARPIMDGSYGTQVLMRYYGTDIGMVGNAVS